MDEGDKTLTLSISDTSTPMLRVKEQSYTNIIILEDDKSTSFGSVADMTVGYHHSCLRYQSGIVKCWGDNSYGQLGIGSTTSTSTPTIVDASLNYKMISAAGRATCGIMNSTNQVKC